MTRRVLPETRCPACEIHRNLCFCAWVCPMETKTQVRVLMHVRERTLTSNTARLAARMLPATRIEEFGTREPLDLSDLRDAARRVAVLFPTEDSVLLDEAWLDADPRPITLVVVDGNWRQGSKMARRTPGLEGFDRVRLPLEGKSRYRLRNTDREGGLSTFEAIARAVSLCERDSSIRSRMEEVFEVMVERRLFGRGLLHPSELKSLTLDQIRQAERLLQMGRNRRG